MTGTVNEPVSVFNISNQTGVVRNTSYNQGRTSFILRSDGLDIDVNLNPVNCSDEGIYFGVLVVGDNVDVKGTNTEIRLRGRTHTQTACI
ncbi:hypothetical protein DPMN_138647 [Dreissena polymorpha]|uniref:Uncharacterized protein n=1 Tax=Dreissena polymorpha TaxID=45954 RepID=A0A9D4GA62_DREPO|nr:hypothetical protein DPMN_138647 [Dreissena polymorpha]